MNSPAAQVLPAEADGYDGALYWSGRGRNTCNFTLTGAGITTLAAMGHSAALAGHIG